MLCENIPPSQSRLEPFQTNPLKRATLWRSIGSAQNIDFSALAHGPNNFRDGLEFFEDLRAWSQEYEKRAMVPHEDNHKLAEQTTSILLYSIPDCLKPAGGQAVVALMDERLRKAMMYVIRRISFYSLLTLNP